MTIRELTKAKSKGTNRGRGELEATLISEGRAILKLKGFVGMLGNDHVALTSESNEDGEERQVCESTDINTVYSRLDDLGSKRFYINYSVKIEVNPYD